MLNKFVRICAICGRTHLNFNSNKINLRIIVMCLFKYIFLVQGLRLAMRIVSSKQTNKFDLYFLTCSNLYLYR